MMVSAIVWIRVLSSSMPARKLMPSLFSLSSRLKAFTTAPLSLAYWLVDSKSSPFGSTQTRLSPLLIAYMMKGLIIPLVLPEPEAP